MKTLKLSDILETQDIGKVGIDKICDAVLSDSLDRGRDPLTTYIIDAFIDNEYGQDVDSMINAIDYAIKMLRNVKNKIESQN